MRPEKEKRGKTAKFKRQKRQKIKGKNQIAGKSDGKIKAKIFLTEGEESFLKKWRRNNFKKVAKNDEGKKIIKFKQKSEKWWKNFDK